MVYLVTKIIILYCKIQVNFKFRFYNETAFNLQLSFTWIRSLANKRFFVRFFISVTIKYSFTWSVNKTQMLRSKTPFCSFSAFLCLTPTSSLGLFSFPFPFSRPTHFLREKPWGRGWSHPRQASRHVECNGYFVSVSFPTGIRPRPNVERFMRRTKL